MRRWAESLLAYGIVYSEGEAAVVLAPGDGLMTEVYFEERLVQAAGLPPFTWDTPLPPEAWPGILEYFDVRHRVLDGYGVSFETFGRGACPMYVLAVTETRVAAREESAVRVRLNDSGREWQERLRQICRITGLPYKDPDWYLVSALREVRGGVDGAAR